MVGTHYFFFLIIVEIFTRVYAIVVLGSSVHATTKKVRQCVCNVTLRRCRANIFAVDKQKILHI